MGFFDFFKGADINQGVREYSTTPGAVLLDVRTPQEYQAGHIPGSRNLPLQEIRKIGTLAGPETPLFVYCHSGARSSQAVRILTRMGYTGAKNIGGITAYKDAVER